MRRAFSRFGARVLRAARHIGGNTAIGIAQPAFDVVVRTRNIGLRQIGGAIGTARAAVRRLVALVRLAPAVIGNAALHTAVLLDVVLMARECVGIDYAARRRRLGGFFLAHGFAAVLAQFKAPGRPVRPAIVPQ